MYAGESLSQRQKAQILFDQPGQHCSEEKNIPTKIRALNKMELTVSTIDYSPWQVADCSYDYIYNGLESMRMAKSLSQDITYQSCVQMKLSKLQEQ